MSHDDLGEGIANQTTTGTWTMRFEKAHLGRRWEGNDGLGLKL